MQLRHSVRREAICVMAAVLLAPGHGLAGQKPKEWYPSLDPGNFVTEVTHSYFPLTPGRRLRYASRSGNETLLIEVLPQKKSVMGVMTTVVLETVAVDGQTVEISENWFAQDREGNVWYFGEFSQDFQNGLAVGTEGSWETGINGAQPGIIMKAHPQSGDTYFQEHAPGVAEDMATVLDTDRTVTVPYGTYSSVIRTKEWTPLEANSLEHKYYAPGIGLILEEKGNEKLELVAIG